jgi:hypothetical protein
MGVTKFFNLFLLNFIFFRMRLIFWWAIFAVIFMGFAWIVAYNKYKSGNKEEQDLIEDEMNQNMGDLLKLEIMRRMAQNV